MAKQKGLVGIDKDFGQDAIRGILVGVAILFVGFIIPGVGTIGIPSVPQSISSTATEFIVVVLLASIFETFFFFDLALSFFKDKVQKFGINLPFIIVAIITSMIFSLFHLNAYGDFASNNATFFSAFLVGLVFSYERKLFNSNIPGILTHMVLNFYLGFATLSLI